MKDQYNNPIPRDLILLTLYPHNEIRLGELLSLNWYYCKTNPINAGRIFVSKKELEKVIGDSTNLEIEIDDVYSKPYEILKIDLCLHRYSEEDGFYWA